VATADLATWRDLAEIRRRATSRVALLRARAKCGNRPLDIKYGNRPLDSLQPRPAGAGGRGDDAAPEIATEIATDRLPSHGGDDAAPVASTSCGRVRQRATWCLARVATVEATCRMPLSRWALYGSARDGA
jgi:hypothetical protein